MNTAAGANLDSAKAGEIVKAAANKLPPWQDVNAKPFVRVQHVTKTFGNVYAVDDVSVDIYQGQFFSLLGG